MNPAGKKFISLFLVFSLMMISMNLYAKERRGAIIVITKKDGKQFQGELIAVKQNSLLILVPSGRDVSFDIPDVFRIRVMRKSEWLIGASIGFLIGGGITALAVTGIEFYAWGGFVIPLLILTGGSIGAVLGAVATGKDKMIRLEGMTDSEIQETLEKLRKQARVRDYK
ncbi:MAG: hypothetical protein JSV46_09595 [Candidatus Aminicenantes bacterium]|nr:MAG: hypothetical protein JSV46_09595 [Candidatus Aminicenantes bacterium]